MTEQAANTDLHDTVRLNERTKSVLEIAFRVNLLSLNAMLIAKRAGHVARGFGVLSDELRTFTHALGDTMHGVRDLTQQAVANVTTGAKQRRALAVFQRCAGLGERESRCSADAIGRLSTEVEQTSAKLRALHNALRDSAADAHRIGMFGGVLARTAKIEAAYGAQFRAQLAEIAEAFDASIASILASLADLLAQLKGAQA
jgi:methyl-accepting chemotaxis protein